MTPGIYPHLSNEAYQRGVGLSKSQLMRLLKSPHHMHALTLPRDVPEKGPTPSQFNGTLTHCALLEPAAFDDRYVIAPEDFSRRTKAGKQLADEVEARGMVLIDQQQRDAAFAQAASLRALPEVAELLARGQPEVSAYWTEDVDLDGSPYEVLCRCRPDWVHECGTEEAPGAVLLDVKTCSDASPKGFAKACADFGYHIQDRWYCRGYAQAAGVAVHGMVFAAVENEFPYAAAVYMLKDEALRLGREKCDAALLRYAWCDRIGMWPGYPSGIIEIDLPTWAR